MKNFVQRGKVLDFVNGTGAAILSGALVIAGALFGIAVTDIAVGETGAVNLEGVYELPKAAGAITQGAKVYWDATAGNVVTTASGNTLIGYAFEAAASGATVVRVLLSNGI